MNSTGSMRRSPVQLDFDDARAAQRARIETFLKQHGGPGRLDPDALDCAVRNRITSNSGRTTLFGTRFCGAYSEASHAATPANSDALWL